MNAIINMTSVEVAFVRLCASIKASIKAKAKAVVRTSTPSHIKAARRALARAHTRFHTRMIGVRNLINKADSSAKREAITIACNTRAKAKAALKEAAIKTGLSEATIKARKEQSAMAKLANVIRKEAPKKAKKAKTHKVVKGIISVRATMEGTHAVDAKAKAKAVVNGGNTLVQDCTKEFMSFKSVLAAKKAQDILNKAKTRKEREARRLARIEAMKTLIGQVWMATGNWMDSDTMLEAANDMDYGVRKEAFAKMRALARGEATVMGEAA